MTALLIDSLLPVNYPTDAKTKAWAEAAPVRYCSTDTAVTFILQNIIIRFGCPLSITNNQGAHFISNTIKTLTREFMIQHHKSSPYNPEANGTIEALNKIPEN